MGIYQRHILPRLVHWGCGTGKIHKLRQSQFSEAQGKVLEIGFGSGHNLQHLSRDKIELLVGIDLCETSGRLAKHAIDQCGFEVDLRVVSAEDRLPFPDGHFDTVIAAFTLCTIPDLAKALQEVSRLLHPDHGKFLYVEHGRSPKPNVRKWQDRLNPIQRFLFGGCHLNRDPHQFVKDQGLEIIDKNCVILPGPEFTATIHTGIARHQKSLN